MNNDQFSEPWITVNTLELLPKQAVGSPVERRVRPRDDLLEALSDKVRMGEPVGYLEAIAVINYQMELRREREANSWLARLKRFLRVA